MVLLITSPYVLDILVINFSHKVYSCKDSTKYSDLYILLRFKYMAKGGI